MVGDYRGIATWVVGDYRGIATWVVGDYRAHALLRVVGHRSYRSNRSYRYWGAVLEDTGLRLRVAWLGCEAITERGLAGVWGDY